MLKIPYGRADFGAMRQDNCFYIDRTNYIEQLETESFRILFGICGYRVSENFAVYEFQVIKIKKRLAFP